jgi:hypothetical protein
MFTCSVCGFYPWLLLLILSGCASVYYPDYHDPRHDIPKLTEEQIVEYVKALRDVDAPLTE